MDYNSLRIQNRGTIYGFFLNLPLELSKILTARCSRKTASKLALRGSVSYCLQNKAFLQKFSGELSGQKP